MQASRSSLFQFLCDTALKSPEVLRTRDNTKRHKNLEVSPDTKHHLTNFCLESYPGREMGEQRNKALGSALLVNWLLFKCILMAHLCIACSCNVYHGSKTLFAVWVLK